MHHLSLAFRSALLAYGMHAVAHAQPQGDVGWLRVERAIGAESCLAESELATRIERQLQDSPEEMARKHEIVLTAVFEAIQGNRAGWRGTMSSFSSAGRLLSRRTVDSQDWSCAEAGNALAIIGALLLASPPPPPPIMEWALSIGGASAYGLFGTRPAFGITSSLLALSAVGPGAFVRFDGWPSQILMAGRGVEIRASLVQLGAGGCLAGRSGARQEHTTFGACLGMVVGRVSVESAGFLNGNSLAHATASAAASIWLQQPIWGGLIGVAGATAEMPLVREVFRYQSKAAENPEYPNPVGMLAISAGIELGIGYRFP